MINIGPISDSGPELVLYKVSIRKKKAEMRICWIVLEDCMLEQVLVLMQAEKEHFTALHLTGMDAGYNGHNALGRTWADV